LVLSASSRRGGSMPVMRATAATILLLPSSGARPPPSRPECVHQLAGAGVWDGPSPSRARGPRVGDRGGAPHFHCSTTA
jgi:hypothetical protein